MSKDFFNQSNPVWVNGLEKEKNMTLGLRGTFNAVSKDRVYINIATSGIYRIFLNGEFINYGPARGPHDLYRVDQIDVSKHINQGLNVIAVEVACYNINSFYILDQPSFIQLEVFINGDTISGTSLDKDKKMDIKILKDRLQKVQRYSYQRTFVEIYDLDENYSSWRTDLTVPMGEIECCITDSKRFLERRVSYPNFNIIRPQRLISIGKIDKCKKTSYWNDRSMQVCETIKGYRIEELEEFLSHEVEELNCVNKKVIHNSINDCMPINLDDNSYCICKLEHNNTGFIGLKVVCTQDTVLYLTFDEIISDTDIDFKRVGCVNAIKYHLKKGVYELETIEPYTLQYLKIIALTECRITDIYLREYVNPDIDSTNFKCDNLSINKIYKAGKRTYKQNALDIFMDCPSRERTGFLCDSFFTGRVEYDLTGRNRIEKNFLENFILPKSFKFLPDGMLPMCYPADHNAGEFIPNWSLWFIIELQEYLKRNNDTRLIVGAKETVYNILKYFKAFKNEDGLLEKLESWIFVEWSKCNDFVQDVNYPTNMLYSAALIAAGTLYQDKRLIQEGNNVKEIIRHQAYNGDFFVDNAIRENGELCVSNNITETCQYYAFFFGIANKKLYPKLYDIIINQLGPNRKGEELNYVYPSNAFIGNYLRLEVLSMNGEHGRVINELEDYFLYMAEKTGTLWEFVGTTASCNHGFASYVIRFIYRDGAGINKIDKVNKDIIIDTDNIALNSYDMNLMVEDNTIHIKYKNGEFMIDSDIEYKLKDMKGDILNK